MSISKNNNNLHIKRRLHQINQTLLINIFKTNNKREQISTGLLTGEFLHSQILIDVLQRMKITQDDKIEFINLCQTELANDKNQLNILYEFKETYSSNQALWWYTREIFLYRLLNQALRLRNIDILYFLRYFIYDIKNQLELNQCLRPIRVYRGQLMSKEELDILKNSIGQFVSTNSFLSTSIDKQEALIFLDQSMMTNNLQRVLFIIDANPQIKGIKSFAHIAEHSYFTDEEEVLFMLGAIFEIKEISYCEKDYVWIIRMILSSDYDHKLKPVFDYMRKEYGDGETGLLSLGRVLRRMGKFDEAEKYYRRFLNRQENDQQSKAQCYHLLGNIALDKGNYELSLEYHFKSLDIKMRIFESNDASLAYSHNSIGIVYWKQGNKERALESYHNALQIWIEAYGEDDFKVAMCFNNMGIIHDDEKNYFEALKCYEKSLMIRLKHLPNKHSDLGDTYNNIGAVHRCLNHYDLALNYFNRSLKIYEKSLFSPHPSIASSYKNIGITYELKKESITSIRISSKSSKDFSSNISNRTS